MDKFVEIINKDFQRILQGSKNKKYHKIFESFEWWQKALEEWTDPNNYKEIMNSLNGKKFNYDPTIDLSKIRVVDTCKYITQKTISKEKLKELYSLLTDNSITDFEIIRKHLDLMFDYNLPSTIEIDEYLEKVKKSTRLSIENGIQTINVLIVGTGPIGLFTALYLNEYYNRSIKEQYDYPNVIGTFINILLLDNRIYKEGVKLPYSRLTQFGFDISQIQPFIKNIYCWKSITKGRHFDFINTLENLLYLAAFERKIPMYFTKKYEEFDQIKKLALDNDFHYIFDCSGGRLGAQLKGDIKWDKYKFKKGRYEVKYVGKNQYRFFVDGKEYKHTTMVLKLLDDNKRQFSMGNIFGLVMDEEDEKIIEKFKNKFLR